MSDQQEINDLLNSALKQIDELKAENEELKEAIRGVMEDSFELPEDFFKFIKALFKGSR